MRIISVRHKGLKRLLENDEEREINPTLVRRVRNILAVLLSAKDMEGVDLENDEISNLDLQDYH